jgi:hypothetical protein
MLVDCSSVRLTTGPRLRFAWLADVLFHPGNSSSGGVPNPTDVTAPRWNRVWLDPCVALCDVHDMHSDNRFEQRAVGQECIWQDARDSRPAAVVVHQRLARARLCGARASETTSPAPASGAPVGFPTPGQFNADQKLRFASRK